MSRILGILTVMVLVLAGCYNPVLPDDSDPSAENLPPEVGLSASTSVFLGDTVSATLTASDPEDDPLTWQFSFDSVPASSSLTTINVDDKIASFTPDVEGLYVIRVDVSDGEHEVTATVDVTVVSGEPDAPTGPKPADNASGVGIAEGLDWNDATDAAGYNLQWRVSGGSWNYENGLTSSSFALPQLAWDTTYEWRVTSTNAAGSEQGPLWTFTTIVQRPGSFSVVAPADGATNQDVELQLDWTNAARADDYEVYFGTNPNPPWVGNTTESVFNRTGLARGTTYYWGVSARNAGGTRTIGTFSFTTELPAPAVPAKPSPADGAADALPGVTLDWANSANATHYDVYLRTGRSSFTLIGSNVTQSRYTPQNLSYNTTYQWYVVAKNAEKSTTGPTWSFTTQSNNLSYQDGGYWKFDGALADESGFAHITEWRPEPAQSHLVPGSTPAYTQDRHDAERSAVALNAGYNQYVLVPLGDLPNSPLANHVNGFSLSIWYREIGTHENTALVSRANAKIGYDLLLTSGKGLSFVADGQVVATVPDSAVDKTWNHVVISWDFDTGQLRIWANGVPVADEKAAPFTNSTSSIYFGVPFVSARGSTYFTGALDDVRIYYRPISEIEAEALFRE